MVTNSNITREDAIIENLEYQIKDNQFSDKEQLFNYLISLRNSGISQLDSKKIRELLNLFDNSNQIQENINKTRTNEIHNSKIRVRKKEYPRNIGNAAFTKVGLLIINIITFTLLIAMIVLLNK